MVTGQVYIDGSRIGKVLIPTKKRQAVFYVMGQLNVSERRVCRALN
jgi:hypothetical protein